MQTPTAYRLKNANNIGMIEFILFLDPFSQEFYSFASQKGTLIQQPMPQKVKKQVSQQIQQLKTLINLKQWPMLSTFQRRPLPTSYLIQSKYKYPVYSTNQQMPKAMLQQIKFNQNSILMKDQVVDYIEADIYLTQIQEQLQYTRKERKLVEKITTNIKLITSINEVILTLGRVILQDYSVVISTLSPKNKLIFKVKDRNQYLYGNDSLMNFICIREALKRKEKIALEIIEASIYDKEQYTKFFFTRDWDDVRKGEMASFPWQDFLSKHPKINFLMWYCPNQYSLDSQSTLDLQKLYSPQQLTRVNQKVKLKLQQNRRKGIRRIPRYLWKANILKWIQKRRAEIESKYVELQNTVIYSGEVCVKFQFKIMTLHNLFGLFKQQPFQEGKSSRRGFLRFLSKQLTDQTAPQSLPSAPQRFARFTECKKQSFIDIIPFMTTISIEYLYGNEVILKDESRPVIASAHVGINEKIVYELVCNLMMELNVVFKVKVWSKEGEGTTVGVGVLKLFDEFGYLVQGKQEIQLMPVSYIDYNRIGCINQTVQFNKSVPFLTIQLPSFRKPVLWSLKDRLCLKSLGYLPSSQQQPLQQNPQQKQLPKLHQILAYNPLRLLKLTQQQKQILKQNYKYYKSQPSKLIYYLYSINWANPYQVAQAYRVIQQWQALSPVQGMFLLNPKLPDEKIRLFALSKVEKMYEHEFVSYSNQLTQALVSFETDDNPLIDLIIEKSTYEPYTVGQEYLWQFRNRLNELYSANRFTMYLQSLGMVSYIRDTYVRQVEVDMALAKKNAEFIEMTKNIKEFEDKKPMFKSFVPEIEKSLLNVCPQGFVFPIRPQNPFMKLLPQQCKLFNSKKMPFSMTCVPHLTKSEGKQSKQQPSPYKVMYKCGDDIKQDNLVLQLLQLFQRLWAQNGYDFKMSCYRVLSTGNTNGFIELVDNAANSSLIHQNHGKDKIIKAFDIKAALSFLEYYNKGTDLLVAKENFLRSSVGYLVGTYILGIGDRHSGNIMVQKNGKFFHIDFGHFLGNFKTKLFIKRQRTPVTFTLEYAEVMGGPRSNDFARFQQYCAQAFNILRGHSDMIISMLMMMVSADIEQLRGYQDIQYVVDKLDLDLSKTQAAQKIITVIRQTLQSEARNIDNAFHEWNRGG